MRIRRHRTIRCHVHPKNELKAKKLTLQAGACRRVWNRFGENDLDAGAPMVLAPGRAIGNDPREWLSGTGLLDVEEATLAGMRGQIDTRLDVDFRL